MGRLILTGSSRCGTTVTRHILSRHEDIHLTNELRIYWDPILHHDPIKYFNLISKNCKKVVPYHRLPDNLDVNEMSEEFKSFKEKHEDTLINRISLVEKLIFKDNFKYYGDKGVTIKMLKAMEKEKINFKLIFIHRDGRDVAFSGFRQYKDRKYPPWSNDMVANILYWAEKMDALLAMSRSRDWLVIKFEDYVENPDLNIEKISNYLDVDPEPFKAARKDLITPNKAHIGYYKEGWPNWRKQCPPTAKATLKALGYL